MKRNFNAGFYLIDGRPLVEAVEKVEIDAGGTEKRVQALVPITLLTVAMTALQGVYEDERNLPAADKISRFNLASRIHRTPVCEVVSEEISLIKSLINKAYPSPLIVAQAWKILDADFEDESRSFGDNAV